MNSRWIFILTALAAGLLFPGVSRTAGQNPAAAQPQVLNLESPHSLGQTFLSRYDGLNGIEIFLSPLQNPRGKIKIHLRSDPDSSINIRESELALGQVTAPGFYLFPFPPVRDSQGKGYYLFLSREGTGPLGVGVNPGNGYFDGSLYRDGTPLDRQLAFGLRYDPGAKVTGLLREGSGWLSLLGLAFFLFVLPGWALLYLWPERSGLDWIEKLGLAVGLSVILYPLLLLWTDAIGLRLGAAYGWAPPVFGLVTILWHNRAWRPTRLKTAWSSWNRSGHIWPDLTILLLLGLIFGLRFYVVRLLDYPLWGDSLQHTMIARLLVDHGGLFNSWEPYAQLETFTYHFGFHAAVAALHWVGGFDLPRATLWVGQILNGAAVLALVPLARLLGAGRWAALGPLLVAGLLSTMPLFYLNWGRYTQLTGQVVLPATVFFLWKYLEAKDFSWRAVFVTSLALAGLALAHYRVAFFALAFVAVFPLLPFSWKAVKKTIRSIVPPAALSALLFFPWFWHVSSGKIFKIFGDQITTPAGQLTAWEKAHNAIGPLNTYMSVTLWLVLALIVAWGLLARNRGVTLVVLWWLLVVLLAKPEWIGLPGTGLVDSFTVFIAVYIPAGILAGFFAGRVTEYLSRRFPIKGTALFFCLLFIVLGLWGARERLAETTRTFSPMVTGPDIRAALWIREHTSPQDRFMVNSVFGFGNSVVVGMDAGGWLPLTAGRKTNLPPLLYVTEKGPVPDFETRIRQPVDEISGRARGNADLAAALTRQGFTHIYVGQSTGNLQIGSFSADPAQLGTNPWFQPIYHRDRVWVLRVVGG
jgi:hypothetical protein